MQESSFVLQEETVACDLIALSKIGNYFSLTSHVSAAGTHVTPKKKRFGNSIKESEVRYLSDTKSEDLFSVLLQHEHNVLHHLVGIRRNDGNEVHEHVVAIGGAKFRIFSDDVQRRNGLYQHLLALVVPVVGNVSVLQVVREIATTVTEIGGGCR